MNALAPARLRLADMVRVGAAGLRTRPLRAVLAALGIAIGVAAMVGVVGISTSSREDLNRQLARLGTNLLTVEPGDSLSDDPAHLPDEATGMIARIGPVTSVTATGLVTTVNVYRNDRIPALQSSGIAVLAARTDLLATVGARVASGTFLDEATEAYPAVVLGAASARWLGVGAAAPEQQIWLGGQWFTVVGVLEPVPLAPELDSAALTGWPVATQRLGFDGYPTTIYTRSHEESVEDVQQILAATANPQHPGEVKVSRPSAALAAKRTADATLTALLLGLGAVALVVGGVGVANTMVISVLERRAEIGLRRALGATRGQIWLQFLTESLLLAVLGGTAGAALAVVVTAAYATTQHWPTEVPLWATAGGPAATLVVGALAGLYPAMRAARLAPTEAISS
jgi:putative ABC transport system permease protein